MPSFCAGIMPVTEDSLSINLVAADVRKLHLNAVELETPHVGCYGSGAAIAAFRGPWNLSRCANCMQNLLGHAQGVLEPSICRPDANDLIQTKPDHAVEPGKSR